jgi:hypothetical protein
MPFHFQVIIYCEISGRDGKILCIYTILLSAGLVNALVGANCPLTVGERFRAIGQLFNLIENVVAKVNRVRSSR